MVKGGKEGCCGDGAGGEIPLIEKTNKILLKDSCLQMYGDINSASNERRVREGSWQNLTETCSTEILKSKLLSSNPSQEKMRITGSTSRALVSKEYKTRPALVNLIT